MNYERYILEAIKGYTKTNPQTLSGIIMYIDSVDKSIISQKDLASGLKQLIEDGKVAEINPLKYIETKGITFPRNVSNISSKIYEQACMEYREQFKKIYDEIESKKNTQNET